MQSIKQMLEFEMEQSEKFTKRNFGLKVGDGFPELVREIAESDKVATRLVISLVMGAMMGKGIAESMPKDKNESWSPVIMDNLSVFENPLSLLYWGIQIGRKMERDEEKSLRKMGDSADEK